MQCLATPCNMQHASACWCNKAAFFWGMMVVSCCFFLSLWLCMLNSNASCTGRDGVVIGFFFARFTLSSLAFASLGRLPICILMSRQDVVCGSCEEDIPLQNSIKVSAGMKVENEAKLLKVSKVASKKPHCNVSLWTHKHTYVHGATRLIRCMFWATLIGNT